MGKAKRRGKKLIPQTVAPLVAPLQALQDLLTRFNERGVIIGGIAASLLGTPRFTADVDAVFLINLGDVPKLLAEASDLGIVPRIADPETFARKSRVLLLRHEASGTDIDISLGMLPFETETVERSSVYQISGLKLRLPTPEDLIILKAVAHRPKDLLDIQAIAASHPNLDKERIKDWVQQFAEALDAPELWDDIASLL